MTEINNEKTFLLKIPEGAEIALELKKFTSEQSEKFFSITGMAGKIKEFELLQPGKQATQKKFFKEPNKIITAKGMIEKTNQDIDFQIHVSVSKDGFTSTGGKLLNGKAASELKIGMKSIQENKAIKMW